MSVSLEDEMKNEISRLEKEINNIDKELEKLGSRLDKLSKIRKKKDHDIRVLRYNFNEDEGLDAEFQTTLARMVERKKAII